MNYPTSGINFFYQTTSSTDTPSKTTNPHPSTSPHENKRNYNTHVKQILTLKRFLFFLIFLDVLNNFHFSNKKQSGLGRFWEYYYAHHYKHTIRRLYYNVGLSGTKTAHRFDHFRSINILSFQRVVQTVVLWQTEPVDYEPKFKPRITVCCQTN